MSHKIAIITTEHLYDRYDDYSNELIKSISDWSEVNDEDYAYLKKAVAMGYSFTMLEQPIDTPAFVAKTVADYLRMAKEQEEVDRKEKERKAIAALERKNKKLLKDKQSKLIMFKRLQEELKDEL